MIVLLHCERAMGDGKPIRWGKASLVYAILERLASLRGFYKADVRLVGSPNTINAKFGVSHRTFDAFSVQPLSLQTVASDSLLCMLRKVFAGRADWNGEIIVVIDPSRVALQMQAINSVIRDVRTRRLVTVVHEKSSTWRMDKGRITPHDAIVDADAIMAVRAAMGEPARGSAEPLIASLTASEIRFLPLAADKLIRVTDQCLADVLVEHDRRVYS